ncbi:DUF7507 domain-containing protein [Streptomyces abyssomicinicus]|uniref:DUF7507 domain-containing protein n=1 Tax=Streptomyces abyssomicinicus TaxID=574929 RepID=UPI00124FDA8C|nr:DUF11 domain-containing protein [Streptomyces abyssomicinicus]
MRSILRLPSERRGAARRRVGCALGVAGMVAAGLGLHPVAQAQPAGVPLVDETFTGAAADSEFLGYGPACLTGAPEAPTPPTGPHPLTGCPPGGAGPLPPNNAAPHGYLRLTTADNDQSAAVLYDHALPANQGVVVTFDQWQYGSTTARSADGISFFLIDGAAELTAPGAFGGSLGYAQKLPDNNPANEFLPGVDHGYLGVGLDVLGNFFGDWEHRGNGCETRSPAGTPIRESEPNKVTLRGPGDGTEGYCFLTSTAENLNSPTGPWPSTLPGQLHGPTTAIPPNATPQEAEALLEESRRTVQVEVSPGPNPTVTVRIDFRDGRGFQQVLSTPAPQPVPASYKFGLAASTGLWTDVHLIRNVTVHPAAELPRLNLVKQVAREPEVPLPLVPGQQVPYQYVVTNSGNTPLTDVAVRDDRVPEITCPRATLAVGASMTCTGTYAVTAADATAGRVHNVAGASGRSNGTEVDAPPAEMTLPVQRGPGLRIEKTADDTRAYRVGEVVEYRYTVTNTGPVEITGLTLDDDHVTGITCAAETLAPEGRDGDSTECRGTYTVTAQDADTGYVTNQVTAAGRANGDDVRSPEAEATVGVANSLVLLLDKSVDDSRAYEVGETVPYEYRVTNSGDLEITGLTVVDDRVTGITCDATTLAPDAFTTCRGTYTVREEDAAEGGVVNLAFARGRSGSRETVSEPDSAEIQIITPGAPRLSVVKEVQDPREYRVGEEVAYVYTVTNTGDREITGIRVDDDRVERVTCEDTTLASGVATTCRGTYTITEEDAAEGSVVNVARALGESGGTDVVSPPDTALVEVTGRRPGLSVDKQVDDDRTYQAGDVVTYRYVVRNTGGTTLTGVRIEDDRVATVTCPDTTLEPGEDTTCTGTYVVTEADAEAGSVTNTARAVGDLDGSEVRSEPDTARIGVGGGGEPGLTVDKRVDDDRTYRAGEVVTYRYVVTNTGDSALARVVVRDDRVGRVVCPSTTLEPGDDMTCTGAYTVTAADARRGRITNTAVATAEGGVRSEPDSVTVQVEGKPCEGKHCKPCDGGHGKPCHGHGKDCHGKPGDRGDRGREAATSCRRDGASA